MNTPRRQDFANHRARLPITFAVAGAVIFLDVLRRGWMAFHERDLGVEHWAVHVWYVGLLTSVLLVWYHARRGAQVVQDRVIRLEMRTRLERLLGAHRRADIESIRLKQLVALRFAGDAELPALFEDVLAGRLSEPDDIKRRVTDWQADWLRV